MAVDLHRGRELLLPSWFLADINDDDEAHNNNNILSNINASSAPNHTSTDFNVLNNDDLQPPFGSSSPELAETETDEEEDDGYIAESTRHMAYHMSQDDDTHSSRKTNKVLYNKVIYIYIYIFYIFIFFSLFLCFVEEIVNKLCVIFQSWGLAGLPHSSMLCSPNHGIPKWSPRELSPPTTPEILKQRTDSCCEILGKLEHLKISNEGSKIPQPSHQQQFQSMLQNPSSTPIPVDNPRAGFCSNQTLLDQIRAIQVRNIIPNF